MIRTFPVHQVDGYPLWLGNVGDLRQPDTLFANGIEAVIDLAGNEPPAVLPRELMYCRFPLVDGAGNPTWMLRAATHSVASCIQANVVTLVYCSAGMSRTPAIAATAIAMVSGCSASEALIQIGRSFPSDVSPTLWDDLQAVMN